MTESNARMVIDEARQTLGTLFGYEESSRAVGITGAVEFSDFEGQYVLVALSGRFWHATDTVVARLDNYVRKYIPECEGVRIDEEASTIKDDPDRPPEPLNQADPDRQELLRLRAHRELYIDRSIFAVTPALAQGLL